MRDHQRGALVFGQVTVDEALRLSANIERRFPDEEFSDFQVKGQLDGSQLDSGPKADYKSALR
jgi:hypothetical protein